MDELNDFLGYFCLVLGIAGLLIGFRIYKPLNAKGEEELYTKYGTYYKIGGFLFIVWALVKIF